ncbi:hypothetical protein [Paenibacillus sp. MMS18-CY102]|uniref:hypothetical protein n=1 Tax=Paenibacillus sp. MMS18-CY102 TaxID=2682849 RepID=UPI0013651BD1|nr:hypothetical protein [Paenibacillus sp. MMS18-CY102]MWC29661.1 hypothetical protein [Paenibacillus sp. MMS18-CY102]
MLVGEVADVWSERTIKVHKLVGEVASMVAKWRTSGASAPARCILVGEVASIGYRATFSAVAGGLRLKPREASHARRKKTAHRICFMS